MDQDQLIAAKDMLSARYLTGDAMSPTARAVARAVGVTFTREAPELPAVHAVGTGRRIEGGVPTDGLSVRMYVTRKVPLEELPGDRRVPPSILDVPTDVVVAPPAVLAQAPPACSLSRRNAQRPVVAGISTSHQMGLAGTIGYFCRTSDPDDNSIADEVFVLSNNHIYARFNAAAAGDLLFQQAVTDGGTAPHVATLHRFVPLNPLPASNSVDAAIGRLQPGVPFAADICTIGAISGPGQSHEDDSVRKHGRTTGLTLGVVDDESIDVHVVVPGSPNIYFFRNQMRIIPVEARQPFALPGDSGSLIVAKDTSTALGLLHATAPDGSFAYASHIADVLSLLKVELL